MLGLGPVAHWESIAVARRTRSFVVRFCYGLVLFGSFCSAMTGQIYVAAASVMSIDLLHAIVTDFFKSIVTAQALAVLILTPALVGGVIAEEKQRGTLQLLLASSLSSFEIVVSKILVRISHLLILLALPLPVLCLLNMLGGLNPGLILVSLGATYTTGFVIATTALAVSTTAQRPQSAIVTTYLIVFVWLGLPFFAMLGLPSTTGSGPYAWLFHESVVQLELRTGITNPLYILFGPKWTGIAARHNAFLWMMASHVAIGTLLLLAAAAALRPLASRAGSTGSRWKLLAFLLSKRPLLPRRACGEHPMLWKESHAVGAPLISRLLGAGALLVLAVALGYFTWRFASPAILELQSWGYGTQGVTTSRDELNMFLRMTLVGIYVVWALCLAARTALCVTSEIERDTWASALATPLATSEIVAGKLLGAVFRLKWLAAVYFFFLGLGVAAGALHPVAAAFVVVQTAVFLCFAAGVGMALSVICKTSGRSLAGTMLALFVINGGYLMCCFPAREFVSVFAVTPLVQGMCLATYREFEWFVGARVSLGPRQMQDQLVPTLVLSLIFYVTSAAALIVFSMVQLEGLAGRPLRGGIHKPVPWKAIEPISATRAEEE
jgi:ABC-type transport system involved in multi-copper enzyme maturation permease subunit